MAHQFAKVSGLSGGARGLAGQYAAEFEDAGAVGAAISQALNPGLAVACDAVPDAQARANMVLVDPRYDAAYKTGQARQIVAQALDAADAALQAYSSALHDAQVSLSKTLSPKLPSGTDGALVAFRAGEVVKLLEGLGSAAAVIRVASGLLADALAQGDVVKAYIVSGGVVLRDTFQRLNVDAGDLQAAFGRAIAAQGGNAGNATPGGQLLAALSQGGNGTLRGYEVWTKTTLYNERANFTRSLAGYVALGVVQDGPGNVGRSA
jgi:hypothetical protein